MSKEYFIRIGDSQNYYRIVIDDLVSSEELLGISGTYFFREPFLLRNKNVEVHGIRCSKKDDEENNFRFDLIDEENNILETPEDKIQIIKGNSTLSEDIQIIDTKRERRSHSNRSFVNDILSNEIRVYVNEEVKANILAECEKSCSSGVLSGVLVGQIKQIKNSINPATSLETIVIVNDALIIETFSESPNRMLISSEFWEKANSLVDKKFNDPTRYKHKIIGWFHTHPNFGTELTEGDRIFMENFFCNDYNLAWIIDPQNKKSLWYGWKEKTLQSISVDLLTDALQKRFDS